MEGRLFLFLWLSTFVAALYDPNVSWGADSMFPYFYTADCL